MVYVGQWKMHSRCVGRDMIISLPLALELINLYFTKINNVCIHV